MRGALLVLYAISVEFNTDFNGVIFKYIDGMKYGSLILRWWSGIVHASHASSIYYCGTRCRFRRSRGSSFHDAERRVNNIYRKIMMFIWIDRLRKIFQRRYSSLIPIFHNIPKKVVAPNAQQKSDLPAQALLNPRVNRGATVATTKKNVLCIRIDRERGEEKQYARGTRARCRGLRNLSLSLSLS